MVLYSIVLQYYQHASVVNILNVLSYAPVKVIDLSPHVGNTG